VDPCQRQIRPGRPILGRSKKQQQENRHLEVRSQLKKPPGSLGRIATSWVNQLTVTKEDAEAKRLGGETQKREGDPVG